MLSRRGFLRLGVAGGALAGLAGLGFGLTFGGYAMPAGTDNLASRLSHLSIKEYVVLRAIVRRMLDGTDELLPVDAMFGTDDDPVLFIDGFLVHLDAPSRRELRGLIHLVEHGTTLFGSTRGRWHRFSTLDAAAQDAVLDEWQSSNLTVRRQGLQGLRSLAFMAYYRQDRAWPALGYTGPTIKRATP